MKARQSRSNLFAGILKQRFFSVTKETYKKLFLNFVIPAMGENFPSSLSQKNIVYHSSASPHNIAYDGEILMACDDCPTIDITLQPANSPDFNVLDLGFFSLIYSFPDHLNARKIDVLVSALSEDFHETIYMILDRVQFSLQMCLQEVMKDVERNGYRISHSDKSQVSSQLYQWLQTIECKASILHSLVKSLYDPSTAGGWY